VPFLLVEHVLGTRGLNLFFGVNDDYIYEALILWIYAPEKGFTLATLLIIAWIHGCIGIHFWISSKTYYNTIKYFLLLIAIVLPLAAVSGLLITAISIEDLVKDPQKLESVTAHINWPDMSAVQWVNDWKLTVWKAFGAAIVLTLLARLYRIYVAPKKND
jgi:adenylate cyclase